MLFDSLIPVDPTTNQPRGYSVLRRLSNDASTSGSLLRLNATKQTWPTLFNPLRLNAMQAGTYKDLTVSLVHALENTPDPVLSRYDDLSSDPPSDISFPISSNYATPGQTSYGTLESVRCKLEYQSRIYAFHEHLEKKCELYGIVDVAFAKLEITVFFLALFKMRSFLNHLQPELRDEVVKRVQRDLSDPWIAKEVDAIRIQMESVECCCAAECKNCG